MDDDRLRWIYSATNDEELRERYQIWATEYDDDLASMGWRAPRAAAARVVHHAGAGARVLDAGCGTGLVGIALHELGVRRLVGFDLSPAMLDRARARGVYDDVVEGSLLEPLPFERGAFGAVVSVGVFTHGHVGPTGLSGLAKVVRPGGFLTMTFRDDTIDALGHGAELRRLEAEGVLTLVERTEPEPLILEDGVGADMRVWTWVVS
jgi:predicted TPR repeat methyltransferase